MSATSARPGRRLRRQVVRRLFASLGIVAVGWLGVGVGLRVAYSGEILPGTRVAGVGLGGTSPAAAGKALTAVLSQQRMTFGYRGRRFSVRSAQAGYRVDVRATVARAQRSGRDGALGGLWSTVASLWAPRRVDLVVDVRRERLDAVVASIAREIDRPPFPGDLAVETRPLRVTAVAPRGGRAVDRTKAADAALAALSERTRGVVPLPVRRRPTVPRAQVEAVARRGQAYVQRPVRLSSGNETVTAGRRDVARILGVERTSGPRGRQLRLGVHPRRIERLIERLATDLRRDAVDARLTAPARPFIVDAKGDVTWRPRRASVQVTAGRAGRVLDRAATTAALASAVRQGRHSARLALDRVPSRVSTEAARAVTSVVGAFTTRFACCEPRVTNIQLIAKAIDETIILPGEQFSLNRVAGQRTRSKGYVPAPFIADGKIVPSVGGGVSQFSTTMYNAAYLAGLRLDRHQPHSFYISRYPAGREATVDYSSIDLVWTNDTEAPVLVRAAADATSVTVTLYGHNGGRRVEARTGPRVPGRAGGFAITVTRDIRFPGGRNVRQPFTTTYDAPPAER